MDKFEVYIQIRQLLEQGFTKTSIAKKLGISRPTLYRYLEKSPKEMAEWIDSTKTRKKKLDPYKKLILSWRDILPPPTLRLEVGASRVIPSHDGKLTERSPCAPRFEDKLDDRQSFHALMFDIDGRIDVPVAHESTFTAECPFRKR